MSKILNHATMAKGKICSFQKHQESKLINNYMIYTNIDNLKIKVPTKSYKALGEKFIDWIENTTFKLYTKRNKYENKSSSILKELGLNFEPQCLFFDSKTKSTYFLDFLLLDSNTAIEIDGSSHKNKLESDKKRDLFFKSIGIKTIRISNENVNRRTFEKYLNSKKIKQSNSRRSELSKINRMLAAYNIKYKCNFQIINKTK